MKHANDKLGQAFEFPDALDGFDDLQNDANLFVVWTNFAHGNNALPIEAQIFLIWYHGMYPEKLVAPQREETERRAITLFGRLGSMSRSEQKLALKRVVETSRQCFVEALTHPKTDARPLVLGAR